MAIETPGTEAAALDLSLERLSADFVNVVSTIFPDPKAAPHLLVWLAPDFT